VDLAAAFIAAYTVAVPDVLIDELPITPRRQVPGRVAITLEHVVDEADPVALLEQHGHYVHANESGAPAKATS
jgi:hypothetical protein